MKKAFFGFMAACCLFPAAAQTELQFVTPVQKPYAGKLQEFKINSPELGREMTVNVWLPETYSDKDTPRRVLYMHDAQNLYDPTSTWNHQAWCVDSVLTQMERRGEVVAPIVVGIYNTPEMRIQYLMPEDPVNKIPKRVLETINTPVHDGFVGNAYADFLAGTLKNSIDSVYNTLPEPENTFVMGSSMGGLASFYAMCRHPEVFGGAGCLSTHIIGAFGPNEIFPSVFAAYLVENLPDPAYHKLYFDTGDQTIDEYYLPYFPRFTQLFEQLGYQPGRSLKTEKFTGAHQESSWMSRLPAPLTFLLTNPAN